MTTMGRRDSFLSGATSAIDKAGERVDAMVIKALEVANTPVYCTKNAEHVMRLVDISRAEICPICKREGVESDVYVKTEIPSTVIHRDANEDADDDEDDSKSKKKGRKLDADGDYDKDMPDGDRNKRGVASKSVETGGMLDRKPIVTNTNKARRPWTGTR